MEVSSFSLIPYHTSSEVVQPGEEPLPSVQRCRQWRRFLAGCGLLFLPLPLCGASSSMPFCFSGSSKAALSQAVSATPLGMVDPAKHCLRVCCSTGGFKASSRKHADGQQPALRGDKHQDLSGLAPLGFSCLIPLFVAEETLPSTPSPAFVLFLLHAGCSGL